MWRDKITFPSHGAYLKFMCFWSRGYGTGWERFCFSMCTNNFLNPVNITTNSEIYNSNMLNMLLLHYLDICSFSVT